MRIPIVTVKKLEAKRQLHTAITLWFADKDQVSVHTLACAAYQIVHDINRNKKGIHAKGIGLYLHQQGVDTTTPGGKALFQMVGVFAEFERAKTQKRVKAGLARARSQGKTLGRPKVDQSIEAETLDLRRAGIGQLKIPKTLGVGTGTVQRVLREAA